MICSMWWSITRFRGRWLHFQELGAGQIARNFETLGALEIIRAALPILAPSKAATS
jgi:hypothetical protein